MQTRKALSRFSGRPEGVFEFSDPSVQSHFERIASANQQRVTEQKQISHPHLMALQRVVAKLKEASAPPQVPIIDSFSALQYAKRTARGVEAKALVQTLQRIWKRDRTGSITSGQLVELRRRFSASNEAVAILNDLPKRGFVQLPLRELNRIASEISDQESFEAAMASHGYSGNRPEQVQARAYVLAILNHQANGFDVKVEDSPEDQVDIPDRVLTAEGEEEDMPNLPDTDFNDDSWSNDWKPQGTLTASAVVNALLEDKVVRVANLGIRVVPNGHQIEVRVGNQSRFAALRYMDTVAADFIHLVAQARPNYSPQVNEQQDPSVDLPSDGGTLLGKDSETQANTSIFEPTISTTPPKQKGTSFSPKNPLGKDTSTNESSVFNPAVSSPEVNRPKNVVKDTDLGNDTSGNHPSVMDPAISSPSRKAFKDITSFDPAQRYVEALTNRPSREILAGITNDEDWMARRAFRKAAVSDIRTAAQQTIQPVVKIAHREDLNQVGEGSVISAGRYRYLFEYDAHLGAPSKAQITAYIDHCAGQPGLYRVITALASDGVVRALVAEVDPQESNPISRNAIRAALGKGAQNWDTPELDEGNNPDGMGADYDGTILNHEGSTVQGAKISEQWGDKGSYNRAVEADSPQDVWQLHRGLGGVDPDWSHIVQPKASPQPVQPINQEPTQMDPSVPAKPQTLPTTEDVGGPSPEPEVQIG